MSNKKYGSDLIVDVIKQYDFDYVTSNPGASFRGLHDSLVNYGENKKPMVIECPHENTAVGIAHGYAKALGKPTFTMLHNLVGLLHGCLAIYYAYEDKVPIIIGGATGPMDLAGMPLTSLHGCIHGVSGRPRPAIPAGHRRMEIKR